MAGDKKGFVLYVDQKELFDKLPNEKAGELIKHIFKYVNDEHPTSEDILIELAFIPIKQQLKRDLVKWKNRANTSRENGKLGGRPKNPAEPKEPIGLIDNPAEPKEPVNVNVNVNDTVNVNVNDTVNDNDIFNKTVSEICNFAWPLFPKEIRPKERDKKWIDTIDKLIRLDNKSPEEIRAVISWTRNDDFWSNNFLSLTKLRSKKDGVKYYDIFNENRKSKSNGKRTEKSGTHFRPHSSETDREWESFNKA